MRNGPELAPCSGALILLATMANRAAVTATTRPTAQKRITTVRFPAVQRKPR